MTVLPQRTARRARNLLLGSTALVAAAAVAAPAFAQTIAAPRDGGTITGGGTEYAENNTGAGGGVYIEADAAPITFFNTTIANTTGSGATTGQAANALGLVSFASSPQSIVLNGSNSFSTTRAGGTAFRAQSLNSSISVMLNSGTQTLSGTDGLHLRGLDAVSVVNYGGPLNITATGQYGVYSRANNLGSTLNLGTVNITATAGTGIYAYGYTGTNVTTSGGTIAAATGIAAYSEGVSTIVSGSTITGNGAGSVGIAGYGQSASARVDLTSNGAISNVDTGILLQNPTGIAANVIRANASIDARVTGIDTGGSTATSVYVANGVTVYGGTTGIARSSAGTTYNSGTIRGGVGISNTQNATVENSGLIEGTTTAVNYLGGGSLTNNSGASITSAAAGINVAGGAGTIDNYGTITAGNAAAIMLNAGGTATNYSTINASGSNSTGLRSTGAASTLDNRGTITANIGIRTDASGSTLRNSGTINATSFAVYVPSGTATLINSGSVSGSVGATLNGGGSITNTGTLSGGSYGITSAGSATTVINSGTISGGSGAMSLSTYADIVTLNSGSTTTGSISLGNGDDTITIMTGATFGTIAGGNGSDTMVLDGTTTGSLNLASATAFEVLKKVGVGTWTLNGAAASPAMAITAGNGTPSGTLVFNGSGLTGTIAVNGATIRATSAGGFGTGAITAIDPTIQYGATGTYANQIILAASDSANDPTRLEADANIVATLTGQLLEQGTGQPLVIGGAGTIALTNQSNFWSGGTRVLAGATLQASGSAWGNGYNAIANDGTIIFDGSANFSQLATISGSGALVKRGSGTVEINSATSYTGATTIEAGTLTVRHVSALSGTSSVSLAGATAVLNASTLGSDGFVVRNLSGVAGSQVWLASKNATLRNSTNTIFEGTLSGSLSTPAVLTKDGAGTLTLTGNNSGFNLPVAISQGTLALSGGGTLSAAGYIAVNGGTFDISGLSAAGASIVDLRGSGGSVILGDKLLTLTAGASGNGFAGVISGTGGVTLSSGATTFSGANSYSGATTIAANAQLNLSGAGSLANSDVMANGYLQLLDADSAVRSLSGANISVAFLNGHRLTIGNGGSYAGQFNNGTLNLTGGTLTLTGSLSSSAVALNGGNLTIGNGGSDGYYYDTLFALTAGTLTIDKSDDTSVANIVGGAGNLVQAGTNLLSVWNNSYTGSTTVSGGTLRLLYGNAIEDSAALIVGAAGTAELFGSWETIGSLSGDGGFNLNGNRLTLTNGGNFAGVISDAGNGGSLVVAGGTLTLTGQGLYTGGTTIDGGAGLTLGDGGASGALTGIITANGTLTSNRSDDVTIDGLAGSGSFVQVGGGTTSLSGAQGFSGTTIVAAGTLAVENAHALEFGASLALTGAGAALDLRSVSDVANITNLSGVAGSSVRYGDMGMAVTMTGNTLFAGNIDDQSTTSGAFSVAGSGTLTLSGQSNMQRVGIDGATLALTGAGALGTGTSLTMASGGLDLSGIAGGSYRIGDLGGAGGTVLLGGTTLTIAEGSNSFGGTLQGSGGLKLAGGSLTLSATQGYTGDTVIDTGATLSLAGATSFASPRIIANGTFDIAGITGSLTVDLTGSGAVALGDQGLLIAGNGGESAFTGTITGDGGGVAIASGHQTIATDWTYRGVTTLLNGVGLTIGDGGTRGSLAGGVVLNGGTLTTDRSDMVAVNGLSGAGSLLVAGSGETRLHGNGTFTGDVTVANGILTLGDAEVLQQSISLNLSGANAVLNTGDDLELATVNNLSGVAGSTVNIGRNVLLLNNTVATTFAGTLHSVPDPNPFYEQGIAKSGAGALTLTGQNTLVSAFIEDGTLALSGAAALGEGANVYMRGGTLDLSGITGGATAIGSLNSDGAAGTVNLGATTLTLNGSDYIVEFGGVIQGSGGLHLADGSSATFTGTNSYSGDTVIDAMAVLSLVTGDTVTNSAGVEMSDASIANSAVTANGIFDLRGTYGQVSVAGLSGSGIVLLGDDWFRAGSSNADTGFSGTLSDGNGLFWKEGSGTLTLGGASDLAQLRVAGGTVALSGDASLGANAEVGVGLGTFDISGINGASLAIADLSDSGSVQLGNKTLEITNGYQTYGGTIAGTGGVRISGGNGTFSGAQLYTGTTAIDAGATLHLVGLDGALAGAAQVDGTLDIALHAGDTHIGGLNGAGSVVLGSNSLAMNGGGSFSGVVSGDGGLTFAAGTSTLGGANIYAGSTTIDGGATLALAGTGSVGAGVVIANGAFDISGTTVSATVANLSGSGTVALGANTLTVGSDGQDSGFAGVIAGSGGLIKAGAGVLTLSGANTYSGLTLVETGTLRLGASEVLADDSTLEVRNGATLDLNGFDETVASFSIAGNLIGSGTLTAAIYNLLGGTIDHDLGAGAVYQRSGVTLLNGSSAGSAVHIEGGTLRLGANERLADNAVVTVLAGATLDLQNHNETAGSLVLAGTLSGTGTLTAGAYTLDGATVDAGLGTGGLVQRSGVSVLNGTVAASSVNVASGTLRFGGSDRIGDNAAVSVAAGTALDLQGFSDTVGALALAGTLSGTGTLTAATYTLDGATTDANLGVGTLVQHSNISALNGTAATALVNVTGGTLRLGASDRIVDTAAVSVAIGATLDVQGFSDTVGSLALAGTLSGTGTLTAASYALDGATVDARLGAGMLIQQAGSSTLNGSAASAIVKVDAGRLRLGANDRLADSAAVSVAGGATLDLQGFNDVVGSLVLAGTLSGGGTLTAASYTLDGATVGANIGAGTLVQHSGSSLLNGASAAATVTVAGGTLRLGGSDRLADTAAVSVAGETTFDLQDFSETVGTLALAGTLSGTGTLTAARYTLDGAIVNGNLGAGTLVQHSGSSLLAGSAASGTVTVDAGTLRLGAADRLADGAAVVVASGATLDMQGFSDTIGTLALAGALSGSGTLTAARYTLDGAVVTANLGAGTLVQSSGTSVVRGSLAVAATQIDGGTLALDRATATTYAGTLLGTGALAQTGTGLLTLSGNGQAFAGTTSVYGGGLAVTGQLGGDVHVASMLSGSGSVGGTVDVANGAHLVGATGSTLTMGSLVLASGSAVDVTLGQPSSAALFAVINNLTLDGTLNVVGQPGFGAGVYRLFTYGGALTDNGLELGTVSGATTAGLSVQTTASGQVNLLNSNSATLAFWDGGASAGHDNGRIDGGAGSWSTGTRNWTDANGALNGPMQPVPSFAVFQGAGGTVTIDNGGGQVSATGLQFATSGYTLAGGALALSGSQATVRVGDGTAAGAAMTATIASALTGSAALVKTDLGTLVLTGANSYTGGTIVQAGTLIGNAGSIRGDVQNSGMLIFDQAGSATFAGTIGGTGNYVKSGAGALTLTGASSSNWQVTAGSLISTTALFTGNADLAQGTSLIFDQTASGTYAGTLTGAGSVLFQGGGTVLLTGNSAGFAGATTVGAGSLFSVNGTMGGTINLLAGGRLQGSGTAGSANIAGTIAPGNSIGTLTFTGNLAFAAGSVFEVEANAAGQSDKIIVNGTASIASGVAVNVLAANGNYAANTSYTILTAAGGVSGTFSNVTTNLAFLTPTLAYGANAVTLSLKRNTIDFVAVAQTGNQGAVAPRVQALGAGNGVYEAAAPLTAAEARAAFDQLAGSDYASMRASLVEDSRVMRDAMLARDELAGSEGLAIWGRVTGAWRTVDGSIEAQGYKRSTQGFVAGFDGSFDGHWRMGAALSYGTSVFRSATATHDAESYQAGASLLGAYGPVSIQLGGAYGWHAIDSQRHVAFGGLSQLLGDKYDARTFQSFGQLSVRGSMGGLDLQPFVSLAHVSLFDAGVKERGGSAALHGGSNGFDATYGSVGLRAKVGWDLGGTKLSLDGSAAARRVFGDRVPTIDLAFAGGNAFQASGIPLDRTSAAVDLGLVLDLSEHIRLGVSYTGTYAERSTDHGARAQLSWGF